MNTKQRKKLEFPYTPPRVGLFGGSFDPIHIGHLEIALLAKRIFDLNELHFILAKRSPFKLDDKNKSLEADKRLEILEEALKPYTELNFKVNTLELNRSTPSYSADTVKEMKKLYPKSELFWIMGLDCFLGLYKWHELDYLIANLKFLVFQRRLNEEEHLAERNNLGLKSTHDNNSILKLAHLEHKRAELNFEFIKNPYIDVSSSEIKETFVKGNATDDLDTKLVNPTKGLIIKNYKNLFRE